jgi:hypothetical protein
MIDIFAETLLDVQAACNEPPFRNPKTGQPLHVSGMYRLFLKGARAADGTRIKLEIIRTPRGLKTSKEAIGRFIAALTNPGLPPPTSARRNRERELAERDLTDAGFEIGEPTQA